MLLCKPWRSSQSNPTTSLRFFDEGRHFLMPAGGMARFGQRIVTDLERG